MEKSVLPHRRQNVLAVVLVGFFLSFTVSIVVRDVVASDSVHTPSPEVSGRLGITCRNGTVFEKGLARQAARGVENFYQALGFSPGFREKLTIKFGDQICPDGEAVDWVIGLYHRERKKVYMCHLNNPVIRDNPRFAGLDQKGLYRSILVHEIAHHFNHCLCPGLFPPVDEAIAGFVQYSVMDPELRNEMLERAEAASFGSVREITIAAYINGPDAFLGAAYLYLRDHPSMVDRILRGQGPLLKDPMFVEYGP